ncbi:MAG: nitrogen fixation/metabolism regulation signal transduction histidine kinase [Candidatus Azotimanducaceae bacterium]|jgi:nitrogen fixation/metabolism regulation signal transduction histidine kinase
MGFNRFILFLLARLLFIMIGLAVLALLLTTEGYYATTLLSIIVLAVMIFDVYRFISKTNQELSRFLDAARYADFGQRFYFNDQGAGFGELGDTFTHILDRFREDRKQQESELRHLKALLEHVPVPLISVHTDHKITLWNNAARRLFGATRVTKVKDLRQFGLNFLVDIQAITAGEKRLVDFEVDNLSQQLTVSASEITLASNTEKLLSLQNIQSELDRVQLSAWQDLVRVLTHEIMNSITPVASLASTAVDLVEDARKKVADFSKIAPKIVPEIVEELEDARDAVMTVARRSDGLMNFVSSYRQLTRLAPPVFQTFNLQSLFEDVIKLTTIEWPAKGISITWQSTPASLSLNADRQMIEQTLINLIQNAEHAVKNVEIAAVTLTAHISKRGHVAIEVSDNGTGIAASIGSKVFVPFYTTRREGSGVGLALSRQIMTAHHGSISFFDRPDGGTIFRLTF